jgi:hypothetical protein
MTHVYFHCSNRREVLVDRCGAVVNDLAEARDHAACVVRSLTTARSLEDWRGWILRDATVWASASSSCARRSEFWATVSTSLPLPVAGPAFPFSRAEPNEVN